MRDRGKDPVSSKTIWLGLITSVTSFLSMQFPQLNGVIESNWEGIGLGLGAVAGGCRLGCVGDAAGPGRAETEAGCCG